MAIGRLRLLRDKRTVLLAEYERIMGKKPDLFVEADSLEGKLVVLGEKIEATSQVLERQKQDQGEEYNDNDAENGYAKELAEIDTLYKAIAEALKQNEVDKKILQEKNDIFAEVSALIKKYETLEKDSAAISPKLPQLITDNLNVLKTNPDIIGFRDFDNDKFLASKEQLTRVLNELEREAVVLAQDLASKKDKAAKDQAFAELTERTKELSKQIARLYRTYTEKFGAIPADRAQCTAFQELLGYRIFAECNRILKLSQDEVLTVATRELITNLEKAKTKVEAELNDWIMLVDGRTLKVKGLKQQAVALSAKVQTSIDTYTAKLGRIPADRARCASGSLEFKLYTANDALLAIGNIESANPALTKEAFKADIKQLSETATKIIELNELNNEITAQIDVEVKKASERAERLAELKRTAFDLVEAGKVLQTKYQDSVGPMPLDPEPDSVEGKVQQLIEVNLDDENIIERITRLEKLAPNEYLAAQQAEEAQIVERLEELEEIDQDELSSFIDSKIAAKEEATRQAKAAANAKLAHTRTELSTSYEESVEYLSALSTIVLNSASDRLCEFDFLKDKHHEIETALSAFADTLDDELSAEYVSANKLLRKLDGISETIHTITANPAKVDQYGYLQNENVTVDAQFVADTAAVEAIKNNYFGPAAATTEVAFNMTTGTDTAANPLKRKFAASKPLDTKPVHQQIHVIPSEVNDFRTLTVQTVDKNFCTSKTYINGYDPTQAEHVAKLQNVERTVKTNWFSTTSVPGDEILQFAVMTVENHRLRFAVGPSDPINLQNLRVLPYQLQEALLLYCKHKGYKCTYNQSKDTTRIERAIADEDTLKLAEKGFQRVGVHPLVASSKNTVGTLFNRLAPSKPAVVKASPAAADDDTPVFMRPTGL